MTRRHCSVVVSANAERAASAHAGVRRYEVEPSHRADHVGDAARDRLLIRDVDALDQHIARVSAQLLLGDAVLLGVLAPDRDLGAGLRQPLRHAEPDAAVAARNQGDLAGQVEKLLRHGSPLVR